MGKDNKKLLDSVAISGIIIIALITRLLWFDHIPPNISGDEVTNLAYVYLILFSNKLSPLSLMGDGSMTGIHFYFLALLVKVFGITNSIFSIRYGITIFSLFSLIPFYFLIKNSTNRLFAFLFTNLLATNYVFLNFSRTAWMNMGIVFSALFMMLFLENGIKSHKKKYFMYAGIAAGLTLYGYQYGRILVISTILFLALSLLLKQYRNKIYISHFLYFVFTTIVLSIPLFFITLDHKKQFFERGKATYVFSSERIHSFSEFQQTLHHQIEYSLRGLIFLDKNVMSEGYENIRYTPYRTPIVDPLIAFLFWGSIIYLTYKKKIPFLWIPIIISTFITVILTDYPPNIARSFFQLLFIYVSASIFSFAIFKKIHGYYFVKTSILLIIGTIIFNYNISTFFSWMTTPEAYNARQPAIDYSEFSKWQAYQINRIVLGLNPITNYEWYEIRKTLHESSQ